jgi:hypothetical protein
MAKRPHHQDAAQRALHRARREKRVAGVQPLQVQTHRARQLLRTTRVSVLARKARQASAEGAAQRPAALCIAACGAPGLHTRLVLEEARPAAVRRCAQRVILGEVALVAARVVKQLSPLIRVRAP